MSQWPKRVLLTASTGILVLLIWLWFSLFSPWGYAPPPGMPPIAQDETHQVFAYGTLRQPLVRWLVVGRRVATQAATLPGFRQRGRNVVAQAGALTHGELFTVAADELRRLDRYERLGIRYLRSSQQLASGASAWVYQRLDDY